MPAADPAYASLTAAMIRREVALPVVAPELPAPETVTPASDWRDDLRLFAVTWAAGFVFFLAFIG